MFIILLLLLVLLLLFILLLLLLIFRLLILLLSLLFFFPRGLRQRDHGSHEAALMITVNCNYMCTYDHSCSWLPVNVY